MTTSWYPVADGALRARTRGVIGELAAALAEPLATASPALALGDAGTAVFFAYLGRSRFPFRRHRARTATHVQCQR